MAATVGEVAGEGGEVGEAGGAGGAADDGYVQGRRRTWWVVEQVAIVVFLLLVTFGVSMRMERYIASQGPEVSRAQIVAAFAELRAAQGGPLASPENAPSDAALRAVLRLVDRGMDIAGGAEIATGSQDDGGDETRAWLRADDEAPAGDPRHILFVYAGRPRDLVAVGLSTADVAALARAAAVASVVPGAQAPEGGYVRVGCVPEGHCLRGEPRGLEPATTLDVEATTGGLRLTGWRGGSRAWERDLSAAGGRAIASLLARMVSPADIGRR